MFTCEICGKDGIATEKGLKTHMTRMHKNVTKDVTETPKTTADPVAPPAPAATVEEPPVSTTSISSVMEGSKLVLDSKSGATIWWQNTAPPYDWQAQRVDSILVKVVAREKLGAKNLLICVANGGTACWAVLEDDVLSGRIVCKELVNGSEPVVEAPTPGLRDYQEEEDDSTRLLFGAAAIAYNTANEAKLAAAKKYKLVDKEARPIVWDYLETNGKETKEGKGDFQVADFGLVAHLVKTPGKTSIKRDDQAIIQWCLENKKFEAIPHSLDVEAWNALKESGVVPAEVIRQVEEPVEGEDKFSLKVSRDKGWDWDEHQDLSSQLSTFAEENDLDFEVKI